MSRVIVVTGRIGSGKSLVCRFLADNGIPVYDSDSRVKMLYANHPELSALVTPDLFSDSAALARLEDALYPVLESDFNEWASETDGEWVAMESAVILQKEYFRGFGDVVLLVDAPRDVRMARAISRGSISAESISQRMGIQKDERSNPRVDFIIDNTGSERELYEKVENFLKSIDYGKREN